jgi:hypothetical protein
MIKISSIITLLFWFVINSFATQPIAQTLQTIITGKLIGHDSKPMVKADVHLSRFNQSKPMEPTSLSLMQKEISSHISFSE